MQLDHTSLPKNTLVAVTTPWVWLITVIIGISGPSSLLAANTVINAGTRAWVQAARTDRADLLIIGDSVVGHAGHGWDAGFIHGADITLGLAGTGLIPNSTFSGEGEGYTTAGGWPANGWQHGLEHVPVNKQGYVWRGHVTTAGDTPQKNFGFHLDGTTLDPAAAYDWHVWSLPQGEDSSLDAYRRLGSAPWTRFDTVPQGVELTPGSPVDHTVFSFDQNPIGSPAQAQQIVFENATQTSILYSRLLTPEQPTGITVSSWGYGGKSTYDFFTEQYLGTGMTEEGRVTWLEALVDGGSGKLNLVIAEGFNDRGETSTSLGGNPDGDSPEAFADNISALIVQVRADWIAAGMDSSDLSFTLLGMYEVSGGNEELRQYADELRQMALADPDISFVDLFDLAPSFDTAVELGYMVDDVHLSRNGALAYGELVMNTLIPEPSSSLLFAWAVLLTLHPRRAMRRISKPPHN
jgi:hypothetical protein